MEDTDNQINNKPWLWKKGQSGNLKGRPKGKTLKEYSKEFLSKMTEEERDAWLEGLPKEVIWKMAEGNPDTKTEHSGSLIINVEPELADKYKLNATQLAKDSITGHPPIQSS